MNLLNLAPLLAPLTSFITGVIIFLLPERSHKTRTVLNLAGAVTKLILVLLMVWGVYQQNRYEIRLAFLPELDLVLRAEPLSMFFALLSASLWLVTTVYAIGYLEDSPHRSRFFGFFSLCMTATAGIALSGNLITFFVFYEFLTLVTYPLVVHSGTAEARHAGRIYLCYTISGGAVLLIAIVWLYTLTGTLEFATQGFVAPLVHDHSSALVAIFALLIAGLGVKAAMVPLHGWLPLAMVAPAPVSALLHAVAVVKAGAFGIVRVVNNVYGVELAAELGVTQPLLVLAAATIIYGSIRALYQTDLKRRLAFSTVSQISYIALGVAVAGPIAAVGGLVHLVHQGLTKITMFFCAGILEKTLGVTKVYELDGVAKRMPWTMGAFTLGALSMIGVPPTAGFFSKWFLAIGGLDVGNNWVLVVLVTSSLFNAAYFLPILYAAWFREAPSNWSSHRAQGQRHEFGKYETSLMLLWPTIVTAGLSLGAGLFAAAPLSPLQWAKFITSLEFAQ